MAFKPEEITRLQQLSDEMATLIEDLDTTSSEATVVYGKIGRTCARALANVAAATAKQTERDKHVQRFQSARQTRRQKKGNVINVSSIAARHGGGAGAIIYAGAKGFISTATHGWAKEVVGDGIRVNAVSPGVITTPFHERYSTPEQLKGMQATIPMNRLGTADECAGTFVYLASDDLSGYVTGQVIEVNGGQYMP